MAVKELRVVVADDNYWMVSSLKLLLELWGCAVTVANDGEAALDSIRRVRPAVAILDVRMPKLDGLEVARRVRAEVGAPAVRLVALTGSADADDRARASGAGFDAHLLKPVDPQILRALLFVGGAAG